jgi:shikimate dehydrogenase
MIGSDLTLWASINGHTRLVVIVADPVGHVRTPARMNAHFAATGRDAVVVPVQVAPGDLAQVVGALKRVPNLGGIVVTVPHKETIAQLCDRLTEPARLVGAVNVIRREADGSLTGGQFDGEGFVAGLRAAGHEPRGARIWMAGAGGAAAGIGYALLRHGAAALTLHNRTASRAKALVDRLAAACPRGRVQLGTADPAGHDIVVNATSLGLKPGDALPVDLARLESTMLAAEVVMQPEITPFLAAAAARGCRTHGGLAMLVEQVAILCDFVAPAAGCPQAAEAPR